MVNIPRETPSRPLMFSLRSLGSIRGLHHACARSRKLKASFNKSGQSCRQAHQQAHLSGSSRQPEQAGRHDNHHFRHPILPGRPPRNTVRGICRNPQLLATILHPRLQPLPAGTALHARSGPRLACQAQGSFTGGPVDDRRNPGCQSARVGPAGGDGRFLVRGCLRAPSLRATMVLH